MSHSFPGAVVLWVVLRLSARSLDWCLATADVYDYYFFVQTLTHVRIQRECTSKATAVCFGRFSCILNNPLLQSRGGKSRGLVRLFDVTPMSFRLSLSVLSSSAHRVFVSCRRGCSFLGCSSGIHSWPRKKMICNCHRQAQKMKMIATHRAVPPFMCVQRYICGRHSSNTQQNFSITGNGSTYGRFYTVPVKLVGTYRHY